MLRDELIAELLAISADVDVVVGVGHYRVDVTGAALGDTPLARAWLADLERTPGGLRPRFDADVMGAALRHVAGAARWAEWESVTAPTRLMVGEHGTLDPDEVRRMAARRDVRTVVVPGAGHDVHLDRPEVTARLVLDFLGGG